MTHGLKMIGIIILLTSTCISGLAQDETRLASGDIGVLIEQLADSSFQTRQRASEELVAVGDDAVPLLTKGLKSGDPEVRNRCRLILQGIYDAQIERRRNAFLAGDIGQLEQNVESWKAFTKLVGNNDESRKMFVDIQLNYGELLELLEDNPSSCSDSINQLCIEKSKTLGTEGIEADRVLVTSISFVGSQVELNTLAVCRGTGILIRHEKLYGHDDQIIRTLLGAWVERGTTGSGKFRLLYTATAFQLDEAVALARNIVIDKTISPTHAIRVLVDQGAIEDVELIEPWIWDENSQKTRRYNKSGIQCSTSDQALAACVQLSGHELDDYGFVKPNEVAGERFGFANDEQRNEARSRWKEFRKNQAN